MSQKEIIVEIQNIIRDILDNKELIITEETNADEIEEWDSFSHLNIIMAIESKFNIKFALGELQGLQNIKELISLVEEKI